MPCWRMTRSLRPSEPLPPRATYGQIAENVEKGQEEGIDTKPMIHEELDPEKSPAE